jgi:hypothetical protein
LVNDSSKLSFAPCSSKVCSSRTTGSGSCNIPYFTERGMGVCLAVCPVWQEGVDVAQTAKQLTADTLQCPQLATPESHSQQSIIQTEAQSRSTNNPSARHRQPAYLCICWSTLCHFEPHKW